MSVDDERNDDLAAVTTPPSTRKAKSGKELREHRDLVARNEEIRARKERDSDDAQRNALLVRLAQQSATTEEQRANLPCFAHYETGDFAEGEAACESAHARTTCPLKYDSRKCCVAIIEGQAQSIVDRLKLGHVPERYKRPVLGSLRGTRDQHGKRTTPIPPDETEPLTVVRAFVRGEPAAIRFGRNAFSMRGDEEMLILGGKPSVGKSGAAAFAIAEIGGRWICARALEDLDFPLKDVEEPALLVIDDLGLEHIGANQYVLSRIVQLLCARYDQKRRTIVTTNLTRADFRQRYTTRVDDRLEESGVFVAVGGRSLRQRRPKQEA